MGTVTFSEAAAMMGWRSRSTLYRLRDDGRLNAYLRPGKGTSQVLELEPPNREPLRSWLRNVVRIQANGPAWREASRGPDGTWPHDLSQFTLSPPTPAPSRAEQQLSEALWREQQWIEHYAAFRDWVTGWAPPGFTLELLKAIPDPAPAGEVMQHSYRMVLDHMKELDRCESRSRFPTATGHQRQQST